MVTFVESTISLVIQVVVLALLISAYMLKKQNRFRQHGLVMFSAVVLHIVSILAVMIPSFTAFFAAPSLIDYADAFVLITLIHVITGTTAAILGVWLVGVWHLQKNLQPCFRRKRVMDITIILWMLSIFIGIFLYLKIAQIV